GAGGVALPVRRDDRRGRRDRGRRDRRRVGRSEGRRSDMDRQGGGTDEGDPGGRAADGAHRHREGRARARLRGHPREGARGSARLLRDVGGVARDAGTWTTPGGAGFDRPYVVSWNLTYRCNLACEHCYLDAGGEPQVKDEAFADRGEMSTEECFAVID